MQKYLNLCKFAAPAGFEPAVIGVKVRYVIRLHQRAMRVNFRLKYRKTILFA
jgi:hypothetical protein